MYDAGLRTAWTSSVYDTGLGHTDRKAKGRKMGAARLGGTLKMGVARRGPLEKSVPGRLRNRRIKPSCDKR